MNPTTNFQSPGSRPPSSQGFANTSLSSTSSSLSATWKSQTTASGTRYQGAPWVPPRPSSATSALTSTIPSNSFSSKMTKNPDSPRSPASPLSPSASPAIVPVTATVSAPVGARPANTKPASKVNSTLSSTSASFSFPAVSTSTTSGPPHLSLPGSAGASGTRLSSVAKPFTHTQSDFSMDGNAFGSDLNVGMGMNLLGGPMSGGLMNLMDMGLGASGSVGSGLGIGMGLGLGIGASGAGGLYSGDTPEKLTIASLSLPYDPPVEGCDLKPYVAFTDERGNIRTLGKGGARAEFRWYRGEKTLCSLTGCNQVATLQCLSCLKCELPVDKTYFCSNKCWSEAWPVHRRLHQIRPPAPANPSPNATSNWDEDELEEEWREKQDRPPAGSIDPFALSTGSSSVVSGNASLRGISGKFPKAPSNSTWTKIGTSRTYTPSSEDIGRALRVKCYPVLMDKRGAPSSSSSSSSSSSGSSTSISTESALPADDDEIAQPGLVLGPPSSLDTSPVLPAPPLPPPRKMIYKNQPLPTTGRSFKTLCYNVLAQRYATSSLYPYCELWALSWSYRRTRLLHEILQHDADILCLQEVQANHFEQFFQPQLSKAGYEGLFKAKTREGMDSPHLIDGCAIFYKRDRFALMEQYGIEFNEAARQHTTDLEALRRLLKGNVALVVVLEEIAVADDRSKRRPPKRQFCVANAHLYWDPEYADVKLWQALVLCQELEKLVLPRQLPLLLCGDFNSLRESPVYEFIAHKRVKSHDEVFELDQYGLLPSPHEMTHRLGLTSAYANIGEPKYTNYTGNFIGVLDYIFYSKSALSARSCLDVDPEPMVRMHTALPSPLYSSDHISLLADFEWLA